MLKIAAMFAFSLFACGAAFTAAAAEFKPIDGALLKRAKKLHESMITIDTHVDFEATLATPSCNPGTRLEKQKVDLVKMEEGGLDAVFFAVWTPQTALNEKNYQEAFDIAMGKFNAVLRMCAVYNADKVALALSPEDIGRNKKAGLKSALIGVENGFPIGTDMANLRYFHDLGARYVTITHMGFNQLGDSSDKRKDIPAGAYGGLSDFGKDVIREMNRLGMMVDVSHCSRETFYEILDVSSAPIVATHSGCRALCDVPRNLDDDQLRALAAKGGTVQIVGYAGYLRKPSEDATVDDIIAHIDYAVELIGIDHVGIGSDFDGGGGVPGFNDPSECMNITAKLIKRGYSDSDIAKIWGGNLLRVWREADKIVHNR